MVSFASTPFATIYTAIIRSSRPVLFFKKGVLGNLAKFTRKHQKEIPVQLFSCEFCKISHNTFFKEPIERLLLHKHLLCLLSYHNLSPFQKRCYTYFLAEYYYGLICRLGTKLSSVCKTSARNLFSIQSSEAFLAKVVNSLTPLGTFAKKAPL